MRVVAAACGCGRDPEVAVRFGLVGRILTLQALLFVVAVIFLPLLVFQLPRPTAVLYLTVTFAAVLVLSGVLIAWRIVRPLTRIIEVAENASSAETAIFPEENVADEMGRLTRAFNRLTHRLAEQQEALRQKVAELLAERRALHDANVALVRSDRLASLGRLAAGMAHELGNPLQSVQGFVALARAPGTTAAESAEYLGLVDAELGRIHRLLRDLVDYARPSVAALAPLELRRPAEAALALAAAQARFRSLAVVRRYDDDAPLAVGDEPRVLQVVLNLLLNAADASEERAGTVTVSIRRGPEGFVDLCVGDDGPGLSAEAVARVFEPFYTTKPVGQGTGLGLAISRSIAESLGGTLLVESTPGAGATFTLRLCAAAV